MGEIMLNNCNVTGVKQSQSIQVSLSSSLDYAVLLCWCLLLEISGKNQDIMGFVPSDCHVFRQGGSAEFAVSQLMSGHTLLPHRLHTSHHALCSVSSDCPGTERLLCVLAPSSETGFSFHSPSTPDKYLPTPKTCPCWGFQVPG